MTQSLQNTLLAVAAIACLSLPASAATVISLNIGTATGSTWMDTSGNFHGTLNIEQIMVTDPSESYTETYNLSPAADDFSLAFSSSTPTLTISTGSSVEAPFANLTPSAAIETGTGALAYTCTGCSSSALSLSLNSGVTITGVLANFLTDLGLPTTPNSLTISGGITGSSGTISSDTITLTDSANVLPEPSSFFLLGAGLAIAALARKRLSAAKSPRACA